MTPVKIMKQEIFMPYSQATFAIVKMTDNYKTKLRFLNLKSYHKRKVENPDLHLEKLIYKQARYFATHTKPENVAQKLAEIEKKFGMDRCQKLKDVLKYDWKMELSANQPVFPVA
jgi:hypothetical protein